MSTAAETATQQLEMQARFLPTGQMPARPETWFDHLRPDELSVLAEVERWVEEASLEKKGLAARFGRALEAAYGKVPNAVREALAQAINQALHTFSDGSSWLVKRETVMVSLEAQLGPLRGPADLLNVPVRRLDEIALHYLHQTKTGVTIEGAAAGVSGLIGLAADIPFLYCMLFKMIQEIALVYSFPIKPPQERVHIMKVLDTGHDLSGRNRSGGMEALLQMERLIRAGAPVEALDLTETQAGTHTQAFVRQLRLARQLAFDLIERKLMQTIVVVGGIIGAASNHRLSQDVGMTAFHTYRRRFVMEVGLRRLHDLPPRQP